MFNSIWQSIVDSARKMEAGDILDILIVTFVIYQLIKLTRETRAYQVLKGLGLIIVAAQLSKWMKLIVLSWVFNTVLSTGVIVLVVVFQPEVRRVLEQIGRGRLFEKVSLTTMEHEPHWVVNEIVHAVLDMAKKRIGALIVVQHQSPLKDILESGTLMDAQVSSTLLESIFFPNAPLHDGAVVVKGERIMAAGCFLPMSGNPDIEQELGTRHRAALGMAETSDALIIIVSEETGIISIARDSRLNRYRDSESLHAALMTIYGSEPVRGFQALRRRIRHVKKD